MKKIKSLLPSFVLLVSAFATAFAAPSVAERPSALEALLAQVPAPVSAPAAPPPAAATDKQQWEKPPCVPTTTLSPGSGFVPMVYDVIRVRAINDLLKRISVCTTLPYENDGVIHSTPRPGLPKKPYGYYLEYTLIVPGRETGEGSEPVQIGNQTYTAGPVLSHRGAERLMIGDHREVYYTPDHYKTFVLLNIAR